MEGQSLKLSVKNLDIASRGVLLNRADARSIGVLDGDRVQVINSKNGVSVAAFVETTSTIAQQGTIGVYRFTNERLHLDEGTEIEVREEGRKLAREFIELGDRLNMKVECALTYGDIPVGRSIGPKLEVIEALRVLEGATEPNSFIQKSLSLAGILLEMSGKAARGTGAAMAQDILTKG